MNDYLTAAGTGGLQSPLGNQTISGLVGSIAGIVTTIGGVVAVIFIIYSGFLFVSSRGNEEKLKKAKATFMWTVIGVAILLGANVIADAVVNFMKTL
ncbi:TrbC/VirB2 family protein [Patescibacteria group bacterium]